MIDIDKNIPLPAARKATARYPVRDMEVGDSFAIPLPFDGDDEKVLRNSIMSTAQYYKRNYDIHCAVRIVVEDGKRNLRVWRTQ